ncbi:Shikimate dehydrogenase [Roseimaritima multifibrata]|uniref:Shikimate dehydrogenase n=1 Tax=Roseimaritima multifibrata TaxID=1930274 RepID=A0A517MEF8_9BACT|nr:hypothetical protein [Roseimaritima multifibrata]QDS93272.1 Shikimate dehydrogenase [Roseimaritima multifibrata]
MPHSTTQPIACVLGHPIAGNPSQFAIERALASDESDWRFLSLDVAAENLEDAIRGAKALGFRGLLVADPHQQAASAYCDQLSPHAESTGLVDTISRTAEGALEGHCFLSQAIADAIAGPFPEPERPVPLTIGVLGDCPTVLAALRPILQSESVRCRVQPVASAIYEDMPNVESVESIEELIDESIHILIRGVSNGKPASVPARLLDRVGAPALVIDMAESTSTSPFARDAQQRNLSAITRLDLMIGQTVSALQCWTGRVPDAQIVREAFEEYLEI